MTSTVSVSASHGSSLHGLALDLLFRINCMGSCSGRWILGSCMGHQYRQAPRVRGCVPSCMDPAGAVCSPSIVHSLNMGTNGSAPGSTRGGAYGASAGPLMGLSMALRRVLTRSTSSAAAGFAGALDPR